jgi:hypothetical protein
MADVISLDMPAARDVIGNRFLFALNMLPALMGDEEMKAVLTFRVTWLMSQHSPSSYPG